MATGLDFHIQAWLFTYWDLNKLPNSLLTECIFTKEKNAVFWLKLQLA